MIRTKSSRSSAALALMGWTALVLLSVRPASAATIWTDWTTASAGTPGSAAGTLGGVAVSYAGDLLSAVTNGTSNVWSPNSSFIGGTVTTSPSTVGDALFLAGTYTGTNTITFATAVVNPVFAIWSLGSPTVSASFTFNITPTLEAGGMNSLYGGQSVTVSGNTVSGMEGNGVVQFTGTFTTISWTDTPENFYGFTVGTNGSPLVVPEPAAAVLLGIGLSIAGLGWAGFRKTA